MSDLRPESLSASLRRLMTRRALMISAAAGSISIALGRSVAGHDDDHDDDSDRDDDVRPSGEVPAGSTEVIIDDDDADAFQPGMVTIDLGQSVTWVNLDDDPHTATGAGFDTGIMQPGDLGTVTFDEPGSFPYSCQIHPEMTGTVVVRDEAGNVPRTSDADATPTASPQASPAVGANDNASVDIANVAFDPEALSISVGTTVIWTNREAIPHTVTADDGSFDSGTLNQGETFEFTFDTVGTFDYVCAIHPSMQGSVVVTG